MFADQALALRIENAEARLMRDTVHGAQRRVPGAFARDLGGGVATFVRRGSPMNKIIGAGIEAAFDNVVLEGIERLYEENREPVRVELTTLAVPDTGRLLSQRGYGLAGFENVLARPLRDEPRPQGTLVHVERIGDERLAEWGRVTVEGFAAPDQSGVPVDTFTREVIEAALEDSMAAPGCERYLAMVDGRAVGAASMRVDGPIALFTGATTLSEHRRRGVQSALFVARLCDARARGAELAVITTAVGTGSQANAMQKGFSLLYARAVLVREG